MNKITPIALTVLALSGCATLTPRDKEIAIAVGTVLVLGAIEASCRSDDVHRRGAHSTPGRPLYP